MTPYRPTAIERAFELAGSDRYRSLTDLRRQLGKEGLDVEQITGPILTAQLKEALLRGRHSRH